MLVHNAAVLEVPVDTGRIFDGDELYQLAVECVLEHVAATNDEQRRRIKSEVES